MSIPRRILITGGAGFLGTNLALRLLRDGHAVELWDNFSTGREQNCHQLAAQFPGQLAWRRIDVRTIPELPSGWRIDEIYNLACPASPPHYQADPLGTTMTCVLGAMNLLELANRHNARILQASTSAVYGEAQVHPQPEGYRGNVNCHGIRACYDEGKRCAESIFFDHHRRHGTRIKVVRIFNTYGPYMQPDDGRVVSNFIIQALRGAPLTIYGDGSQTRSFCYCDDLIEGLLAMMSSPEEFTGPVNLGNPGEFTIVQLARMVLEKTGDKSPLEYHPLPPNDPMVRQPDISLARRALGWSPKVPIDVGLDHTIKYFQKATISS